MKTNFIPKVETASLPSLSSSLILLSLLFFMLLLPRAWGDFWVTKRLFLIYAVAITAFIQIFIKKDNFNFHKIDVVFLGFILWNFLSYFWATNPSLIWDKSFAWLFLYCLFKTVSSIDFSKLNLKIGIDILLLALVFNNLMLAWFYFEISTQGDTLGISYQDIFQIQKYFAQSGNTVGALLAMTFPLYILLGGYRKRWKFLILGLASFHVLFLIGLNCRGAVIAVIIQFIIWCLMNTKKARGFIWILPVFLLMFILASFLIENIQFFNEIYNPFIGILRGHDERLIMWESSIRVWQENIWIGKGTGNWIIEAPKYPLELFFGYDDVSYYQHPHNMYFHVLSELGLVGLLAYLGLIFYFLFFYLKKIKTSNNKLIYQVLLLILMSYLVISTFFGIVYSEKFHPVFAQAFLFLSFGMGMALHQKGTEKKQSYLPFKILIFFLACSYIGYFYFCLEKQRQQRHFITLKNKGKYEKALKVFDILYHPKCYTIFHQTNRNISLKTHQALIFWKQKKREAAINTMFEAIEDQPNYHMNWFHFGNMYYGLKDYENAKICYENVYILKNNFMKAQIKLISINLKQHNMEDAKKWFHLANSRVDELINRSEVTEAERKRMEKKPLYKKFKKYEQQLNKMEKKLEKN